MSRKKFQKNLELFSLLKIFLVLFWGNFKISTVDYLTSLVLNEMDFLEVKQDMKTLEFEVKQVNEGNIKPKPARLLLNEL